MDTQKFEEELKQMTKPEINELRHQDLLSDEISKAKDRSVVTWWWLCVPLYIAVTLLMKVLYMPGTSLISNFHEFAANQKYLSALFFLILPGIFIIINLLSIKKIYYLSGSPGITGFLKVVWYNILIIIFSIFILIIYSL